ncbi:MAG TPA: hypothetical protein VKX17_00865 [Planctomycetota bacterium]|nr:hypothetical protein [Planctomycetota bacterium]
MVETIHAEQASAKELRFNALADEWYEATRAHSSIALKAIHPAYQQIIGMGEDALPFIFKRLQTGKGHWFWALTAITGEMPIPKDDMGRVPKMKEHWIKWGQLHGYVDSAG